MRARHPGITAVAAGLAMVAASVVVPVVRVPLLAAVIGATVLIVATARRWGAPVVSWVVVTDARADWAAIRRAVAILAAAWMLALVPAGWWLHIGHVGWSLAAGGVAWWAWDHWTRPAAGKRPTPVVLPDAVEAARRIRRGWKDLAAGAGWTVTRDGRVQRPRLVSARPVDDDAVAVTMRPLESQGLARWDEIAHQIRRHIGAPTVRWWTDPTDSGLLVAHIGLVPLPDSLPLSQPPPPAGVDRHATVYLGAAAGGGVAAWRPAESPHMLIAGQTGGGKGVTIRLILTQLAGWDVRIVNPKLSGEFGWLAGAAGVVVVDDPDAMTAVLRDVEVERQARQAVIAAAGVDTVHDLPDPPRPILLVVDETSVLLARDLDADGSRARLLLSLARMGRSAAVHLLVATQRPDVQGRALGPHGGAMREQLSARLAVGRLGPDGLRMVFDAGDGDLAAGLPGIPGRGLASGLDAQGGGGVHGVHVAHVTQAVAATRVARRDTKDDTDTPPYRGGWKATDADVATRDTESDTGQGRSDMHPVDQTAGMGGDDPAEASTPGPTDGPDGGPPASGDATSTHVVSIQEAAARLGVTPRTIQRWRRTGDPRVRDAGPGRVEVIDTAA